jgi:hypothetical protein
LTSLISIHYYRKKESLDAIRKSAPLVLIENAFIYDGKCYKQIIGSAMESPFSLTKRSCSSTVESDEIYSG